MGGARHLARMAPQPVVRRLFFTGELLPAEEFRIAGGAIIVCEDRTAMMKEAHRLAARVAGYSPTAIHLAKGILNRIEFMDLKSGYIFEQGYTVRMSGHPDSKEALAAFREKREAKYQAYDGSEGVDRAG